MSAVITKITSDEGGRCEICYKEFNPGEQQFTHEGDEVKHDGFHKHCLKEWLKLNPTCPHERHPLDPNSLLSRTDRIMARLKPALVNSAYSVFFGAVAAGEAAVIAGGGGGAVAAAITGAVIVLTAIAEAEAAGAVEAGIETAAGAIAMIVAGTTVAGAAGIANVGAGTGIAAGIGALAGFGSDLLLNLGRVDRIARENIGFGMQAGAIAGIAATVLLTPLAVIPAIALVGGGTAGILSLIRG